MKKVYRNYLFLLLIICQCGWIIVGNNPEKTIEKGIVNEKKKDKDKDKKEKEGPKSNRRNKKSRRLLANVSTLGHKNVVLSEVAEKALPAVVVVPQPIYEVNMPQEENEYYQFNSVSKSFHPIENESAKMGFDPVRFTLRADQDLIELGKEFEIKILAEFLDVSPNLLFQFDGSNEYTLKMLMPKGFILTGGTYYDFIEDRVTRENPRKELTIKGFFESKSDDMCFSLLRSFKGASVNDVWIRKANHCVYLKPTLNVNDDVNSRVADVPGIRHTLANSTTPCPSNSVGSFNVVITNCKVNSSTTITDNTNLAALGVTVYNYELSANNDTIYRRGSINPSAIVDRNTDSTFIDGNLYLKLSFQVFHTNCPCKPTPNVRRYYYATCVNGTSNEINTQITGYPLVPQPPTVSPSNPTVLSNAETVQLTASCPGENFLPTWPSGSRSATYNAKAGDVDVICFRQIGCEGKTKVTVENCTKPAKPSLSVNPTQLKGKGNVQVSATPASCPSGTIEWDDSLGTGFTITKYITRNTTFKAACIINGCKSDKETIVCVVDTCSNPAPEIKQKSPVSIASGQNTVTLSVENPGLCSGIFKWSNDSTGNSITVGSGTYYVKCVDDNCESPNSGTVKVQSCTEPTPPTLSALPVGFDNGGGKGTLFSNGCAGTVTWDHYMGEGYSKPIDISATTTYKATCTVDNCVSKEASITVLVSCDAATTPTISILSTTSSSTTLQASNCNGTIIWNNDLNQIGSPKTFTSGGNYYATCRVGNCDSPKSNTLYLGGGCGDYEVWAYSNANANPGSVTIGDNLVLSAGVTGRPASDYDFAWYYGGSKISGAASAPTWTVTNASNSGTYTVHVRRLGSSTVCTRSFNVNISPCNLHAGASWRKDGSNLAFSIWSDKDLTGATINWTLPYGPPKSEQNFSVPADENYRGNYTLSITLRGCTVTSYLTNINFDANPNYDGAVEYAWCDFVKGRVEDKANPTKNVSVKLFIDGVEAASQVASNRRFSFDYPVAKKDGNPHNVEVRYSTPGHAKDNTVLDMTRSVTCCQLEFASVTTPIATECDVLYNKGKATVAFVRTSANSTVSYRLLKKFYNEAQQVYYEPVGDWKLVATNGTINSTVEVNNLEDGHYKIELREGTVNPCFINAIFTIDCKPPVAGCKVPNITVTPGDTIREGVGIVPTLYADFVGTSGLINTNPNNNNGLGGGYFLNGNSEINLTAIDDKQTFTFEAWIRPEPTSFTTVGLIGGGEKHRFLIQSLYNTGTRFKLSAGANGLTLIEELQEGSNFYRRVALSYENAVLGMNHIALVYENNLPKLYLNGNLVASATETIQAKYSLSPSDANYVLAGRQLGFHSNMGFIGHIDEIRGWTVARSQTDIQAKKDSKRDATVISSADIQGYWSFNTGDGLKNLKYPAEIASREGASEANLDAFPTYNAPTLNWYVGDKLVGTGLKHVMADSMIRADGVTYIVKYTGANAVACQTEKTVTIKRATQNKLSGCFFVSPNYETTRKVHFAIDGGIPRLLNTRTNVGEDGIWEFEHDADGIYRIILPYNEQLVTNGTNGVQLAARVTNAQNQLWKFKFIDSLSQNPTIKLQSRSNNQFLTSTSNTANLSLSADAGPTANSQIFKLEKTTCPVPPKACTTDGQITIEKITGISAATTTYLEQNDDMLSAYVGKFRGSGKTVNKWGNNTTRINFTNSIPANDVRTDDFVVRLTGYFCAPGTGEFQFGLVGVDKSQLFVSPSEDERTKERLVKNTSTIGWDSWTDANRAKYYMTQNRTYYVEATMLVNAATSEYLKLGVSGPGITDNGSGDQGVFLQHFSSSPRDKKPARIRDDSEACGKVPAGPLASDDLPFLMKGDTIFAGDFKVIVDAVTGANGTFSGTGTAKVKYMFDTPIKVRFDGVQVNDYYDLVSGEITTEYDKEWSNVMDVDTLIKDVIDGIKSFADGADKLCKFDEDKYSGKALSSLEKPLFDAAAKEIDDALANDYKNIYTGMVAQMAIIDANRAACRAIPPDQTACNTINQAKTALDQLNQTCISKETQRTQKRDEFVAIIKAAMTQVYNEMLPLVGGKETTLTAAETALGLSTGSNTSTEPFEEPFESEVIKLSESNFTKKTELQNFVKAEVEYNEIQFAKIFCEAFKTNNAKAEELGKNLSKGARTLGKYIIDNPDSLTQTNLTTAVAGIIKTYLKELMITTIYGNVK